MRSGQHLAEFTWDGDGDVMPGVMGAGFDVENKNSHTHEGEHKGCVYYHKTGERFPGLGKWEGIQPAFKGDRIGMELDLDAGSMTVYKNGERLGVMQESGLTGEYVWAAVVNSGSVRIAGHSQGAEDFDPAFTEACLKWKLKRLRERDAIPAAEAVGLRDWLFSAEAARLAQMPAEDEELGKIVHDSVGLQVLDLKNAAADGRTCRSSASWKAATMWRRSRARCTPTCMRSSTPEDIRLDGSWEREYSSDVSCSAKRPCLYVYCFP